MLDWQGQPPAAWALQPLPPRSAEVCPVTYVSKWGFQPRNCLSQNRRDSSSPFRPLRVAGVPVPRLVNSQINDQGSTSLSLKSSIPHTTAKERVVEETISPMGAAQEQRQGGGWRWIASALGVASLPNGMTAIQIRGGWFRPGWMHHHQRPALHLPAREAIQRKGAWRRISTSSHWRRWKLRCRSCAAKAALKPGTQGIERLRAIPGGGIQRTRAMPTARFK